MKLPPLLLPLVATLPRGRWPLAASQATPQAAAPAASHRDAGEPDWRNAYQRLREQDPTETATPLLMPLFQTTPPTETAPETAPAGGVAPTSTATRIEAARQLAEPQAALAAARVWQVELPAMSGPAWQLHVEQAQPLAPLNLELRVPPVAQSQARQQLGDLDKRLRDAGHEVLRLRLRDAARAGKRSLPVDEVQP
ncbi:hypothetical protein J2X20_003587 [Pelomonas saccharophila]|uniref:Flagellar hook-length control protein-like C-terminal domain-containing protein n=1 Tax=Roseateles saccharophilus TaxID=304 RepID=A0ABU1YPZ3_ROSSA|nr:hypothetical protein [Roseateles saccharophilus]MDR7270929.1 hypothetical protein [Roseateles saccharophilus]